VESRLESITTPAGLLKNVAAATAMALNGVQVFTATASQTIFTTTIPWDTSFSNLTVTVVSQGLKLNPALVTVANSSGALRVTIPAQTAGNIVQVLAYSAGAGVLTRLASLSAGDGATLVAVRDLGGYWTSAEVESALQEVGARIVTLEAGDPTRWRKDGANGPATGNWNLGGYQIKGLAPGTLSTDAVNLAQLMTITNEVSSVLRGACTVYGFTMQGGIDMDGNAIENLPTPLADGDAATKKYVDDSVAGGTSLLAEYLKRDGANSPSANISWNSKKITSLADGTSATDAVNLGQLEAAAATRLAVDGSNSPTDNIDWDGNKITGLADGVDPQDAAAFGQIPDVSGFLERDGSNSPTDDIDWDGNKITGLADGVDPQDAVTVSQVASLAPQIYGMVLSGSVSGALSGLTSSSMVIGAGPADEGTWPALTADADGRLHITGCGRIYPNDISASVNIYIRRNRDGTLSVVGAATWAPGGSSVSLTRSIDVLAGDQFAVTHQTNLAGLVATEHCMSITG
jgi:hypothetical protein